MFLIWAVSCATVRVCWAVGGGSGHGAMQLSRKRHASQRATCAVADQDTTWRPARRFAIALRHATRASGMRRQLCCDAADSIGRRRMPRHDRQLRPLFACRRGPGLGFVREVIEQVLDALAAVLQAVAIQIAAAASAAGR